MDTDRIYHKLLTLYADSVNLCPKLFAKSKYIKFLKLQDISQTMTSCIWLKQAL